MDQEKENMLTQKVKVGYFHILTLLYVTLFTVSNTAAIKIMLVSEYYLPAGMLYFPIIYILNDVITEVYGFRASRRVIWLTIFCSLLFTLGMYFAVMTPGANDIDQNKSFDAIFALSPRILIAAVSSFLIGEYANSAVLAISKIRFNGKYFGARAILSTMVGVVIESAIFAFIAFYERMEFIAIMQMVILLSILKVLYELVSLPLTIMFVKFLKRKEGLDYYDYDTNFSILPSFK